MRIIAVLAILTVFASGCNSTESLDPLENGQFAPDPDTIAIKITGYKPQTGKVFQNIFLSNDSVRVKQGQLFYSTARDGFYDTFKTTLIPNYGFSINGPETVVTGFADLVLFDAGINISQQPFMFCGSNLMINGNTNNTTSADAIIYNDDRSAGAATFLGLRDCDKVYMGMNPNFFDNNSDGIPDYVEMKCGMSAVNKGVANASTAGDGVTDETKCKQHIPIDESAFTQPNQIFAYKYTFQINQDGTTDFTIANIPVLNSGSENFITINITETDAQGGTPALDTAYAVMKAGYVSRTLTIPYWGIVGTATSYYNAEIVVP